MKTLRAQLAPSPGYGPIFGNGFDLYISNNAASNTASRTDFNVDYKAPPGVSNTQTILAGTKLLHSI